MDYEAGNVLEWPKQLYLLFTTLVVAIHLQQQFYCICFVPQVAPIASAPRRHFDDIFFSTFNTVPSAQHWLVSTYIELWLYAIIFSRYLFAHITKFWFYCCNLSIKIRKIFHSHASEIIIKVDNYFEIENNYFKI